MSQKNKQTNLELKKEKAGKRNVRLPIQLTLAIATSPKTTIYQGKRASGESELLSLKLGSGILAWSILHTLPCRMLNKFLDSFWLLSAAILGSSPLDTLYPYAA